MQPNTVFFSYEKNSDDYTLTVVDELYQKTKSDSYILNAGTMSVSIECLQKESEHRNKLRRNKKIPDRK